MSIRPLTLAELRERRQRRENPNLSRKKKKRQNKIRPPKHGNRVVVSSVSIMPELKVRAEREIGAGNFSRAVTIALTEALHRLDLLTRKLSE